AEDDVTTDDVTFISALMTTLQLQHLEFAQQLHACLIKKCKDSQTGLEPDVVTFVAVLSACSYTRLVDTGRVGLLDEAHNFSKQLGVEFINDQLPLKLKISQEFPFYHFGGKRGVPDRKRRVLSKMITSIKLSD
ncbi:hypothetical protein MTR67_048133, partial [Solanum verrucosum]